MDDMMKALQEEIPRLRRYAVVLARDRDRADDLVQDCLTRAVSRRHTFQPGTNLRAWLFTILRNGFISDLRRLKKEPSLVEVEEASDPGLMVRSESVARLHLREVFNALRALSDEHREILELVVIEGITYEGAAEILEVPVGTVRSRLSRARAALRRRLDSGAARVTKEALRPAA